MISSFLCFSGHTLGERAFCFVRNLASILFIVFFVSACAGPSVNSAISDANDPAIVKQFEQELLKIAKEASKDPSYRRIPLDSKADQEWFMSLAFIYWDKKASAKDFIEEGLTRFPDYRESFEYIARKIDDI